MGCDCMTEISWNELRTRYETGIGLGGNLGFFDTDQYEKFDDSRAWDCSEKSFWGPRRTGGGDPTRGQLWIAPYDDQWKKGYAFVPIDAVAFNINSEGLSHKFIRQMPSKNGYHPSSVSDRTEIMDNGVMRKVERKEGGGMFPHCAFIFSPDSRASTAYKKMFDRETRNPQVRDLSPYLDGGVWDSVVECDRCESEDFRRDEKSGKITCESCKHVIVENIRDDKCVECGSKGRTTYRGDLACEGCGLVIEDVAYDSGGNVSDHEFDDLDSDEEIDLVFPEEGDSSNDDVGGGGGQDVGGPVRKTRKRETAPLLSPEPVVHRDGQNLLAMLGDCLDGAHITRIERLMSGGVFRSILVDINARRGAGMMDSVGPNAWIVWNKLRIQSKPLFNEKHFIVAGWIWGAKTDDKLDNALLCDVHRCLLGFEWWTPRDVLMVVEILRLMWWEQIEGDFEWTAFPPI